MFEIGMENQEFSTRTSHVPRVSSLHIVLFLLADAMYTALAVTVIVFAPDQPMDHDISPRRWTFIMTLLDYLTLLTLLRVVLFKTRFTRFLSAYFSVVITCWEGWYLFGLVALSYSLWGLNPGLDVIIVLRPCFFVALICWLIITTFR